MSDPVDTDELRAITRDRDSVLSAWEVDAVIAAADEVDRLRAELAISENRAGGYEEVVIGLRAVIENAPHGPNCENGLYVPWTCTCWKAEAL